MAATLVLVAALSLVAPGQQTPVHAVPRYQAIILRRSIDVDSTIGTAVGGGWQGGYAVSPADPVMFQGRSDRWRSLRPPGTAGARILGMDDHQQVGFTQGDTRGLACGAARRRVT